MTRAEASGSPQGRNLPGSGRTPRLPRGARWLADHDGSPSLATPARNRAAWLTGQSSTRQQRLSPAQERVLDALAAHGWEPLRAGFPWTERAASGVHGPEPLLAASVRNTTQGLLARPGSALGDAVAHHLQPLLDATSDRLLLLCASAGARLVSSAVGAVTVPEGLAVDVVGIGAVGALPPTAGPWRVRSVRGRADLISALGHPGRPDRVVPGGHLSAATSDATVAAVLQLVGPAGGPDATAAEAASSGGLGAASESDR